MIRSAAPSTDQMMYIRRPRPRMIPPKTTAKSVALNIEIHDGPAAMTRVAGGEVPYSNWLMG